MFTIGYGSLRTVGELIDLLRRHRITVVVDVRSTPHSKFRPDFTQGSLRAALERCGLEYTWLGNTLGGMPSDPSCHTDGKVNYAIVHTKGWFQEGLDQLEAEVADGRRVALLCAELEPERCHRSKLIGEALAARGLTVIHIDGHGESLSHDAVMIRLTGGQTSLFEPVFTSRRWHRPGEGEVDL